MNAIQQLLTEHIGIWSAADTEKKSGRGRTSGNAASVYGIKKLRELILELAVRGKLVPQDAKDEPASELLKRNQAMKINLGAEGKTKKGRLLPPIVEADKPFDIHQGWCLEKLGNLANLITKGTTPTSIGFTYQNSGISFVKVENVRAGRINIDSIDQYISEEADEALARSRLLSGDVLFSIAGTIGRTCIVYPDDVPANTNQAFAIIRGTETVFYQMFLLRQLDSFVSNKIKDRARGGAMYNVSLSDLAELVLLIPPLAEQHRIVAKVDELMALCDQLETQHNNAAEAHEKLVSHLLGTLTQSQDAEDFSANWQRIAAHFDTLFTTEASIDVLKQTLLQLAVMGKLVPQDATDEPASELLKRIKEGKAKLVAEGMIKKAKPLPSIVDEEIPYALPKEWECQRLGELVSKLGSGSTPRGGQLAYVNGGIPFLRSQNVWNDGLRLDDIVYISEETHLNMDNTVVYPGDILLNITGASLGRSTIYPDSCSEANVNQHVTIIRPIESEMTPYLLMCIQSPLIQRLVWGRQVGMAIEGLSKKVLELFEMPIPALNEQKRIVAKFNELMALCDRLKILVTDANQLQQKLADVIVEQAVA